MHPKSDILTLLALGVELNMDTRRLSTILSGPEFWDCSPYSGLQTWLGNDVFFAEYARENHSTFTSIESSTPSICQDLFSSEPYVLKPETFGVDSWRQLCSPDPTSPDDSPLPSTLVQRTGKETILPPPMSPTLDDLAAFPVATSIWTDSLSPAKFSIQSSQELNLGASGPSVDIPGISLSPSSKCLPKASTRFLPKGLLGWGDTSQLQPYTPVSSILPRSRKARSQSPDDPALDPQSLTLAAISPLRQRRQSTFSPVSPAVKSHSLSLDSSDDDANGDEDISDDYQPSRSPSPKFHRFKATPHADSSSSPKFRASKRGIINKTKKKRGSAALALAVVTEIGEAKREARNRYISPDRDAFDPVRVYREGNYVVKKRKNQTIPVPIPVPNLNKKSRGRKVPFLNSLSPVSSPSNTTGSPSPDDNVGERLRDSRRSKRVRTVSASDDSGPSRSFLCVVPGCGKCFVRAEHLKRHVRSIHTNDKRKYFHTTKLHWLLFISLLAHSCPIKGCNKAFSRRDNLGQHVRVHLQP